MNNYLKPFIYVLAFSLLITSCLQASIKKPRLLVLTDIGGDPDDIQSLRRLLVYANEFRIEGLIATSNNIPRLNRIHQVRTDLIFEAIDDYEKVWENLLHHSSDFPKPDALRLVVRSGQVNRGVDNLLKGKETPGSRQIIETVDSSDEILYISIWGGAHDLAQALLDMSNSRSPEEAGIFISKLRVYAILDQDGLNNVHPMGTGEWIRQNFPGLRYVESGPLAISPFAGSFRGIYQNDSKGGNFEELPLVKPGLEKLNDTSWIIENVINWGPLGERYPNSVHQSPQSERNRKGVKEGDTPSWFFVLPNGLSNPEHPEWGGWGGRFDHQGNEYYTDAEDDHWSGHHDIALRRKWTIARWREAYQNDFAARMRWCLLPYEASNHNPVAAIGKDKSRRIIKKSVKPGNVYTFDASSSYDPDGNNINFNWWIYHEVSSSNIVLSNEDAPILTVEIPSSSEKGDIHLILEIRDDGDPQLTAYRRLILEVN